MNIRIGRIGHLVAPGYGHCLRCKTPWRFVREHITAYNYSSACFALCEKCWAPLTPDQRLPYYREQIWHWSYPYNGRTFDETWREVKTAVLAGL